MFQRFPVFLIGSGLGAVLDYTVTLALHDLLHVPAYVGLAVAMTISASVTYLFHQFFTFEGRSPLDFCNYIKFMTWSVVIYFMRTVILVVVGKLGVALMFALAFSIAFVSVINYFVSSRAIFIGKSL